MIPKQIQTLFFSATINYSLHTEQFFKKFLATTNVPKIIDLTQNGEQNKTVKELTQKYMLIPEKTKELYLIHIMITYLFNIGYYSLI